MKPIQQSMKHIDKTTMLQAMWVNVDVSISKALLVSFSMWKLIHLNKNILIVLTEGNTEEFTYKGCIETGFDVNKVKPNPAHTKAEKRETFEACYTKQCNMKPIIITPAPETTSTKQPAQTLTCYACNGEDDCNQENLKTVDCAVNSNTLTTYVALSNHYQIQLRSPQKTEYECFTIDSKLTGNIESHLVYKGCVEKGFEGCKQKYNPDIYRKETKKHCKICPEELCNKNGSNVVVTSFWWAVLSLLVAKRF